MRVKREVAMNRGIALTPQILEALGFRKSLRPGGWDPRGSGGHGFRWDIWGAYLWEAGDKAFPRIQYLHQLEGVWLALTGEPLDTSALGDTLSRQASSEWIEEDLGSLGWSDPCAAAMCKPLKEGEEER